MPPDARHGFRGQQGCGAATKTCRQLWTPPGQAGFRFRQHGQRDLNAKEREESSFLSHTMPHICKSVTFINEQSEIACCYTAPFSASNHSLSSSCTQACAMQLYTVRFSKYPPKWCTYTTVLFGCCMADTILFVASCNLPHALWAEWLWSFTCSWRNMGVEWIPK